VTHPDMSDPDLAMQIAALASAAEDPMTRFVRSLPDNLRAHAEETLRMRQEFLSNATRMLSCSDPNEAVGYASWVSKYAGEVAYRWTGLMSSVTKWSMYRTEATFVLRSPQATNTKEK
jgi:hypothetical protein